MKIHHSKKAWIINCLRVYFLLLITALISGAMAVFSAAAAWISCIAGSAAALFIIYIIKQSLPRYEVIAADDCLEINSWLLRPRIKKLELTDICYTQLMETPLQRLFSLCTVIYRMRSGAAVVTDISIDDAGRLMK